MSAQKRSFGGTWCAVPKCLNNTRKKNVSMFRFPKNSQRCLAWVTKCGRLDLIDKGSEHLYNNYKVCSKHFTKKMFLNDFNNRLNANAVPTLFLLPQEIEQDINKENLDSGIHEVSILPDIVTSFLQEEVATLPPP